MDFWNASAPSPFAGTGLALSGELSTNPWEKPTAPKGRKSPRVALEMGAGLRQRGASGISVQVVDLSTDGFRAATHLELEKGSDVWLRLPGLEASHAKVVWCRSQHIGCVFERPLHPAVLDMVVKKVGSR